MTRGGDGGKTKPLHPKKGKGHDPDMTKNRLLAQREAIDRKLAAINAGRTPATGQAARTAARHRA